MAISSISGTSFPSLSLSDSSLFSTKPKLSSISLPCANALNFKTLKPSHTPPRSYAAVESLESQETIDSPEETTEGTGSEMVPKQKIRIKVRSYWVPLIEDTCKKIMDAARNTNAKTMGPVPLPTKKRIYCLLKSPHGHKDARFHFEIRTHQRLIDILYPTAQTIDSLMLLDIPAGVDVKVKL